MIKAVQFDLNLSEIPITLKEVEFNGVGITENF